jgi:hypothetical protein
MKSVILGVLLGATLYFAWKLQSEHNECQVTKQNLTIENIRLKNDLKQADLAKELAVREEHDRVMEELTRNHRAEKERLEKDHKTELVNMELGYKAKIAGLKLEAEENLKTHYTDWRIIMQDSIQNLHTSYELKQRVEIQKRDAVIVKLQKQLSEQKVVMSKLGIDSAKIKQGKLFVKSFFLLVMAVFFAGIYYRKRG